VFRGVAIDENLLVCRDGVFGMRCGNADCCKKQRECTQFLPQGRRAEQAQNHHDAHLRKTAERGVMMVQLRLSKVNAVCAAWRLIDDGVNYEGSPSTQASFTLCLRMLPIMRRRAREICARHVVVSVPSFA
jgi:hypothetical protein